MAFDINEIGSRFCVYLRKSRADLMQEALTGIDTLEAHRTALYDLAARMGATIIEEYHEIGSAESIEDREEMQKLLEDVEDGEWDGVFCMEVERLSRGSQKDQGTVGEAFVDSGTFIITPQKVYDPTSESDMEYFDFGLFMSRREYLTIRRRLLNGKLSHCRRGEYIGKMPPYGYDKVVIAGMKTLKPNDCAIYVQSIFDWYKGGDSMRTIAKRLTKKAVPTANPNSKKGNEWNPCSVKNILHNHVYIGMIRWQNRVYKKERNQRKAGKKRKKVVRNPSPHLFKGLHSPIVDQETFDCVQERLAGNKSPFALKWSAHNYYAGLIRCAECGAPINYDNHRKNPYMLHRGWDGCDMKSCRLDNLDNLVIAWLTATVEDLELEVKENEPTKRLALYAAEKARLEEAIAKSRRIMEENADRLEEGIYTNEQYLERQAIHQGRIDDAVRALENLKEPTLETTPARIATIHETICALRDPHFDVLAKNELLKSVIQSIAYTNRSKPGSDSEMLLEITPR